MNPQSLIPLSSLILLRFLISYLPILNTSPNTAYIILLLVIWLVYTILKHHGLLPKKDISGQHVLITGGGMGIGRQMCLILAKLGCKISILDINLEAAQKVAQEINTKDGKIQSKAYKCDVSNRQELEKLIRQIKQSEFGQIDILINNAGIVIGKSFLEESPEQFQKTMDVNFMSHSYAIREILPDMVKRDSGHIVTIASVLGHMGASGVADYCGSKFACVGFDECLRMELANLKSNVKTTCICPAFIKTGMFKGAEPNKIVQFFAPLLEESYVAQRVINGLRQNECMVITPYIFYLICSIKTFIPSWMHDLIMEVSGCSQCMTKIQGRK